jgi:PIN domain nuclease of toxin-antitoxin system
VSAALDASALLAYLQGEEGADEVAKVIATGAVISSANLAEVLSKRADVGDDPAAVAGRLVESGLIDGAVKVVDLDVDDAVAIARLRSLTKSAGLSLGDRACLATGQRRMVPVLTADSAWKALDVAVTIRTIR